MILSTQRVEIENPRGYCQKSTLPLNSSQPRSDLDTSDMAVLYAIQNAVIGELGLFSILAIFILFSVRWKKPPLDGMFSSNEDADE